MTCPKTNNKCERKDCLVECQSKGFIYLHPVDGFTFLENVPEKPKPIRTLTCGDEQNYSMYELELAAAIEKRMVIGNPEVLKGCMAIMPVTGFLFPIEFKEGELYPWPGTWEKKYQYKTSKYSAHWTDCHISVWQEYTYHESKDFGLAREVVILSPPKELFNTGNVDPFIKGSNNSEPVNSSMSEKEEKRDFYEILESMGSYVHIYKNGSIWLGSVERTIALELVSKLNPKREPVVSQDQEELWLDVLDDLETGYSDKVKSRIIEELKKKFTITRNP